MTCIYWCESRLSGILNIVTCGRRLGWALKIQEKQAHTREYTLYAVEPASPPILSAGGPFHDLDAVTCPK